MIGESAVVTGAENADAAAAPIVIVTVPFGGAAAIYGAIAPALGPDSIVCDCTTPLMTSVGGRPSHAIRPWHGSAAEFIQTLLPKGTRLVAAFHTIGASALRALEGSPSTATRSSWATTRREGGHRVADRGHRGHAVGGCRRLQMARIAETMTPRLISVNGRYKIHEAGFRMTGRETWGARDA